MFSNVLMCEPVLECTPLPLNGKAVRLNGLATLSPSQNSSQTGQALAARGPFSHESLARASSTEHLTGTEKVKSSRVATRTARKAAEARRHQRGRSVYPANRAQLFILFFLFCCQRAGADFLHSPASTGSHPVSCLKAFNAFC